MGRTEGKGEDFRMGKERVGGGGGGGAEAPVTDTNRRAFLSRVHIWAAWDFVTRPE